MNADGNRFSPLWPNLSCVSPGIFMALLAPASCSIPGINSADTFTSTNLPHCGEALRASSADNAAAATGVDANDGYTDSANVSGRGVVDESCECSQHGS